MLLRSISIPMMYHLMMYIVLSLYYVQGEVTISKKTYERRLYTDQESLCGTPKCLRETVCYDWKHRRPEYERNCLYGGACGHHWATQNGIPYYNEVCKKCETYMCDLLDIGVCPKALEQDHRKDSSACANCFVAFRYCTDVTLVNGRTKRMEDLEKEGRYCDLYNEKEFKDCVKKRTTLNEEIINKRYDRFCKRWLKVFREKLLCATGKDAVFQNAMVIPDMSKKCAVKARYCHQKKMGTLPKAKELGKHLAPDSECHDHMGSDLCFDWFKCLTGRDGCTKPEATTLIDEEKKRNNPSDASTLSTGSVTMVLACLMYCVIVII